MGKQEAPMSMLEQFLPEGTFKKIAPFFREYDINLSITHDRVSVLGDYRTPTLGNPAHRISINGSLNPYSFLITLLHELAHMMAYIRHRRSIQPHGAEWKAIFADLLSKYMGRGIFPENVEEALLRSLSNITASTCSDPDLYRALKKHDRRKKSMRLVEDIPLDDHFETHDGRVFQKKEKLRTRFRCKEISTGYVYLFPAIAEVKLIGSKQGSFRDFFCAPEKILNIWLIMGYLLPALPTNLNLVYLFCMPTFAVRKLFRPLFFCNDHVL